MSKHGITTPFTHKATTAQQGGHRKTVYWFKFPNGYTASVFREPMTKEERYELAVMRNGRVVTDTPITGDVVRYATIKEITQLIDRVAKL